jgi:hypothetical protein
MPYPNYIVNSEKIASTGIYANVYKYDVQRVWQAFKLPPLFPLFDRLSEILPLFHRMCCELVPEKNAYQRKQQEELKSAIALLFKNKVIATSGATNKRKITRRDLHDFLTDHPLVSTLVLIASNHQKNEIDLHWWTLLTARIYLLLPDDLYCPLLALDKARALNIDISMLTKHVTIAEFYILTNFELKAQLVVLNDISPTFDTISQYLVRKPRINKIKKNGLQCLTDHPFNFQGDQLQQYQFVDESGEVQQSYLTLKPSKPLSIKSQQQHYRQKLGGLKSAIRRQNLKLPLSQKALTPKELEGFLTYSFPQLMDNTLDIITQKECWYWVIIFLELWLDLPYSQIKSLRLFNQRTRKIIDHDTQPGLHYHLTNDGHCHAYLVITQLLVKGKQAPSATSNVYSTSSDDRPVTLIVPYPLQHLLYIPLKLVNATKRHANPLVYISKIDEQQYRNWLKEKIKAYNSHCHQYVKATQIRSCFHHYISGRIPSSYLGWQQGSAMIQHYYSNADKQTLQYTLHNQWLNFIKEIGFTLEAGSLMGSDELSKPEGKNSLQSFGAALSVKQDHLKLLADYFENSFIKYTQLRQKKLRQGIEKVSQLITCYIALRACFSGGLRPVKQPFPAFSATSLVHSIFTTQDKDAHQNGEHRLIFLDNTLSEIWKQWTDWFYSSSYLNISEQPSLANLKKGQPIEMNKEVLQNVFTKLNIQLDPNSFRQSLCTLWIDNDLHAPTSDKFNQQHLNLQMNHFKIGQSPLGQYNLCSPIQLAVQQSVKLSSLMSVFNKSDKACLLLIEKLIDNGRAL